MAKQHQLSAKIPESLASLALQQPIHCPVQLHLFMELHGGGVIEGYQVQAGLRPIGRGVLQRPHFAGQRSGVV